jgi:hypothetical protein
LFDINFGAPIIDQTFLTVSYAIIIGSFVLSGVSIIQLLRGPLGNLHKLLRILLAIGGAAFTTTIKPVWILFVLVVGGVDLRLPHSMERILEWGLLFLVPTGYLMLSLLIRHLVIILPSGPKELPTKRLT